MEAAFELTEADLHEVQRHLAALRRRRLRSPWVVVIVTTTVGLVCWPVARVALAPFPGGALPVWVLALLVAGVVVNLLHPRLPEVRFRGLERWSLKRATAASVKRSVLGPVTIVLTAGGIKRLREGAPALELTGADIKRLTVSPVALVLHLSLRRVLVVPRRAFTDDAEALAFQRRVEALTSKPVTSIAPGD